MLIKVSFEKEIQALMISRGLDKIVLANKSMTFNLEDSVTAFKPNIESVKSKLIGEAKQLQTAKKLIADPFKGSGVHVINSFPSDLRAKIFTSVVMHTACQQYRDSSSRALKGRAAPLWVRVFGGYGNDQQIKQIRDAKPSLLIISNISNEATPAKIEKLRDILDVFDNIPRIVVTGGDDPVTLFGRRINYPIVGAIRLGCNEKVNLMDM